MEITTLFHLLFFTLSGQSLQSAVCYFCVRQCCCSGLNDAAIRSYLDHRCVSNHLFHWWNEGELKPKNQSGILFLLVTASSLYKILLNSLHNSEINHFRCNVDQNIMIVMFKLWIFKENSQVMTTGSSCSWMVCWDWSDTIFLMNPTSILLPWLLPLDLDTFLWERTNYLKNEGECVHLRVAWTVSPGSRGTWYWTILTWAPYLIAGRFCTRNNVVCLTYRSTRSDWVWLKVNQWFHPKIFIRWLRQKKSSRTLATFCEFTIIYNTIKTVLWLRLEKKQKKICGFMMRWWVWPDKCWATLFYCIFLKIYDHNMWP